MPTPIYFPPLANGMITQLPYSQEDWYDNVTVDSPSGKRYSYNRRASALWAAAPIYTSITDAEVATLEAFFTARQGRLQDFIFVDPGGNLIPVSENYADASWSISGLSFFSAALADPWGGSLASGFTGGGSLVAPVLPDGSAPAYWLTASIWARCTVGATTVQIGFTDGTTDLATNTFPVGQAWKQYSCSYLVATASPVSFKAVFGTLGSGALVVFGAQCSPLPTPGPYVRSPEGWGLRRNCRFETDTFAVRYVGYNQSAVSLPIRQHA